MPLSQFVIDTLKEAGTNLSTCEGVVIATKKRFAAFDALATSCEDAELAPAIGRFRDECVAAMEALQTTLAKF